MDEESDELTEDVGGGRYESSTTSILRSRMATN